MSATTDAMMEATTMMSNMTDYTATEEPNMGIGVNDATWVLISTFIIFTMQSGFGLLESGCVSSKNEVNIMYKNAADVIFGGTMYWLVGYGLSYGTHRFANEFCGWGMFALHFDDRDTPSAGDNYVSFTFQLSFASTATTIVSGAVAERVKLHSYIIFAIFNTFSYCIPAHWIWDSAGFLNKMHVVDIAGSGVVHLCGGTAGLIFAIMLGPRKGRYDSSTAPQPGNGTNILLGTFILWWGWLGFNCGSTFGVSNNLWILAGRSAATTLIAAMGGGVSGVIFSLARTKGKHFLIGDMANGVLGALVSITAPCALVDPWEAFIIGLIGGIVADASVIFFDKIHVDDPVGAISVHGMCGIWGMLSVGLFMHEDTIADLNKGELGLFHGGDGYSLGVQALACVCIIGWVGAITLIICLLLKVSCLGLRMDEDEEYVGADSREHDLPLKKRSSAYGFGDPVDLQLDSLRRRNKEATIQEEENQNDEKANGVNPVFYNQDEKL